MDPILRAQKSFNGIQVMFLSGDVTHSVLFSYENLIELGINVSSLLDHPEYYGVDSDGRIVRTDFCKMDLHSCEEKSDIG